MRKTMEHGGRYHKRSAEDSKRNDPEEDRSSDGKRLMRAGDGSRRGRQLQSSSLPSDDCQPDLLADFFRHPQPVKWERAGVGHDP